MLNYQKHTAVSVPNNGCLGVSQGIFLVKAIYLFNKIFVIKKPAHPGSVFLSIFKVKAQPEFKIVIAQYIFSGDNPHQLFLIIDHRDAAQPH